MDIRELQEIVRQGQIMSFLMIQKLSQRTGDLYQAFFEEHPTGFSYKTWQRDISELGQRGLITGRKIIGGAFGSTTMIETVGEQEE